MPSPGLTIFGMAGNYAARRSGIVRGRTVGTQQIAFAAASNGERAPNLARIGQEWPSLVAERGKHSDGAENEHHNEHDGQPAALAAVGSDCCRAFRASFAPIRSFELGVAESVLSIDSLRSSSATRSSSWRRNSRSPSSAASAASRLAVSAVICPSFAPTTARNRATSSPPCSPPVPGPSGTSRKHAQPVLKVQPPAHAGVSPSA